MGDKIFMGGKAVVGATMDNVLSKTYLQSLHDIVDALFAKDERTVSRYFSSKFGSYWPNVFNKLANDPYLRHAYGMIDEVKKRTGLGEPVSPRYNFLGEAHKNPEGGVLRFFNSFVNPVGVGTKKKDILAKEMIRLGSAPEPIGQFYKGLDLEKYKKGKLNGRDAFNQFLEKTVIEGLTLRQKLEQVIQSDEYATLGDPIRGRGVADDGAKLRKIKYFYNLYKDDAELKFESQMKDFKFVDDDRRNLSRDTKIQDNNQRATNQKNRTDESLKNRLLDLNDFSTTFN